MIVATLIAAILVLPAVGNPSPDPSACNLERGRALFSKCAICHTNDAGGAHLDGPNLDGIVGRRIAAADGFVYSDALKNYGEIWSLDTLDRFIADPQHEVPGTTMAFAGLKRADDRRDLVCYLTAPAGK